MVITSALTPEEKLRLVVLPKDVLGKDVRSYVVVPPALRNPLAVTPMFTAPVPSPFANVIVFPTTVLSVAVTVDDVSVRV